MAEVKPPGGHDEWLGHPSTRWMAEWIDGDIRRAEQQVLYHMRLAQSSDGDMQADTDLAHIALATATALRKVRGEL